MERLHHADVVLASGVVRAPVVLREHVAGAGLGHVGGVSALLSTNFILGRPVHGVFPFFPAANICKFAAGFAAVCNFCIACGTDLALTLILIVALVFAIVS